MLTTRPILAALLLLAGSSSRLMLGQESAAVSGGELLGPQVAEILQRARAGARVEAISALQSLASDALRANQLSAWAWAQTGAAEQLLLIEEEGTEWSDLEPLKLLSEVIEKAGKAKLSAPLSRALAAHARCLVELDQPLAAAREWQRAGSLALDAGMVDRSIEFFTNAARVFRNQNQAARVRESVTWLETVLKERAADVSAQSRKTVESFINSAKDLLVLTPEASLGKVAPVALHPLGSGVFVSSSEHEDGRCRFVLQNRTSRAIEGLLTLTASAGKVASWEDHMIVLEPSNQPKPAQQRLRLLPGESRGIYLGHRGFEKVQTADDVARLSWSDANSSVDATATFHFTTLPVPVTQVVNASQTTTDPGRPVPLYHEIYSRGKTLEAENFVASVSQTARLEFYNEETGELLAVDGEGDGDFSGPADFLESRNDRDSDGRPDLVLGPNSVGSLEIFVFPKAGGSDATQLFLNLADYSGSAPRWRHDAPDILTVPAQ